MYQSELSSDNGGHGAADPDASFGYNTGKDPVNTYLQDVDIRFVVNDIMNRYPPFVRKVTTGGSTQAAFDISQNPVGRTATIVLTKTW